MLRENSKNFVDGTQNERIEKVRTDRWLTWLENFKNQKADRS